MFHKRRNRQWRRTLYVEALEDRAVLSNVTAVQNPVTGVLTLTGDNGVDEVLLTEVANTFTVLGEGGTTINGQAVPALFTSVTGITGQFFNGNNNVSISGVNIPGALTITAGTGNNSIVVQFSTFGQADITAGAETKGAVGSNTVILSQDTITGNHVNVSLLNESGVSGVREGLLPLPGISPGSVNTVSMETLQFTGRGNLNTRVDDGVVYFDPVLDVITPASSVTMDAVSTAGNINVTLGDHFENVVLGSSSSLAANNLTLSTGSDLDKVVATANVAQSETVTMGNVSTYPIPPLPPPSVLVSGTVGSVATGTLHVAIGSNANTGLPGGWPVEVTEMITGSLDITAGNGDAVKVDPTSISGSMAITMGNGGMNDEESLTLLGVVCSDPQIFINSKVGDTVNINLTNVVITYPTALLFLVDLGHGTDDVILDNVKVGRLIVLLSNSGHNVVAAHDVTVTSGFIFGGTASGNRYIDNGGNSGYSVSGFGQPP